MLTIIVPTYNRERDVLELIASIKKSVYRDFRIVVVDDCSTDNTAAEIKNKCSDIIVLRNEKNLGAAASRNFGIKKFIDDSDFFLFLDSDEVIESNTISYLLDALKIDENIAAASPSVYYFDQPAKKQYGEVDVGLYTGWNYSRQDKKRSEPWFIKSCGGNFLIKKQAIKKVGLFDESFHTFYEDADYSLRIIKAGYKIIYVPQAKVFHKTPILDKKQATRKWLGHSYLTARNKIIFMRKHSLCFPCFVFLYLFYLIGYTWKALQHRDFKALREFYRGARDGFKRTSKLQNNIIKT